MNNISADILEKSGQGDLSAFEEVYKASSGFVYNVAVRITRNSADAEEVTQDVFMKIYHNLKDFGFRCGFKTWVYRITVNTAINHYRKNKLNEKDRVDYDTAAVTVPASRSTEDELMQKDNETQVNGLLSVLSPKHKTCLILREIEGLSYEEIAAALKIPVNTVRSRLKRARAALIEKAGERS